MRTESGEVEGRFATENRFGEVAPDGRCLLESMPREAVGEKEALDLGPFTEDSIAIEKIDGVEARPSPNQAQSVEARSAFFEVGPE